MKFNKFRFPKILKLLGGGGLIFALTSSLSAQTPVIANGDDYTLAIDAAGNMYSWGSNQTGQLGAGLDVPFSASAQVVSPGAVWLDVAVSRGGLGAGHVLAIQSDGSLWAWGNNSRGQLGLGSFGNSLNTPTLINGTFQWVEVAVGQEFSLARRADGRVFVWGDNTFGQINRPIFDIVPGGATGVVGSIQNIYSSPQFLDSNLYQAIAATKTAGIGIRTSGSLYTWGYGTQGELGRGALTLGPSLVTQVFGFNDWDDLFTGPDLVVGLRNGDFYSWGTGIGRFGTSPTSWSNGGAPSSVEWASISLSQGHALALTTDGHLYGIGTNQFGQLGLPLVSQSGESLIDNYSKSAFFRLLSGQTIAAAGAGTGYSVLFSNSGVLLSSGLNTEGRLGRGADGVGAQYGFDTNTVGGVDLNASSLVVAQQLLEPGEVVDVSLIVENLGTGTLTDSFDVQIQLSTTGGFSALGENLSFEGGGTTETVNDDIAAGGSETIPLRVEIPASVDRGDYFLVAQIDTAFEIEEADETNNDVSTEASYEFYPDIILTPVTGVSVQTPAPNYEAGDPLTIELGAQNIGAGNLPANSGLQLRVFLSPTQSVDDPAAQDFVSDLQVGVGATSNSTIGTILLNTTIPDGLSSGDYYVNAVVDVTDVVAEQSEVRGPDNSILRANGEQNNVFFSTLTTITIVGIDLAEAMDQPLRTFETTGDGTWFGQDNDFNFGLSAAQSPSLATGQTAIMSTTFDAPAIIQFDWRASTTNAQNTLSYQVIGGLEGNGINEITGETVWITDVTRAVAAGSIVQWVYTQGAEGADDAVYVDNLRIFDVDKPDLVIDSVDIRDNETNAVVANDSFVLLSDDLRLNLNIRNQGVATGINDEFVISVYLSSDQDLDRPDGNPTTEEDVLLRTLTVDSVIEAGDPAVQAPTIELPSELEPGNYYIIAYIDDFVDEDGNPVTDGDSQPGQIVEFTEDAFPGETNNIFVSELASVEIIALPDLAIKQDDSEPPVDLITVTPGYSFVTDEDGNPTAINFDFELENRGLVTVAEDIRIHVLLSNDPTIDPATDSLLLEYIYRGGIAAGSSISVSPDLIEIPSTVPVGELLYFGVFVDAGGEIVELDESNNGGKFRNQDFLFSQVTLEEALDLTLEGTDEIVNDEVAPFDPNNAPWVGISGPEADAVTDSDAAMSVQVGDNAQSFFELKINLDAPTIVNFRWKVSSQNNLVGFDGLYFYVDPVFDSAGNVVNAFYADAIGGVGGGWTRESVFVPEGEHTLRWAYRKDGLGAVGEDRGWVDEISYLSPNLTVTDVSIPEPIPSSYSSGAAITDWSVTIENNGSVDVPVSPPFGVQIRMSTDNTWGSGDEYVLLSLSDSDGLAAGESRTYSQADFGQLVVPGSVSLETSYFLGAYVDWSEGNPATGVIPETNDASDDNSGFTATAALNVEPTTTIEDGVDNVSESFTIDGAAGWYGIASVDAPDGVDFVRSGAIETGEQSVFRTIVTGPSILTFKWRIDSESQNTLDVDINGAKQLTISGVTEWADGDVEIFIPAGTQEVSWTYTKVAEPIESLDAAFVDQVEFTPYTDDELALTSVNYTAGEYILDVIGGPNEYLGTEFFEIAVEAENQGNDITGGTFSVADVEVRLSTDQTYGNADDIILGTFSSVDSTLNPEGDIDDGFSAGGLLRFLGPIELGDHIPEDDYYVIAKIDTNEELAEYDEENNLFISENRDVSVTRLPALRIVNPEDALDESTSSTAGPSYLDPTDGTDTALVLDEGLFRYDRSPMRLQFGIQNVGLDRVEGSIIWTNEVTLRGVLRVDLQSEIDNVDLGAIRGLLEGGPSVSLGEFTVQELLEGRSDAKPTGDTINVDLEFALPTDAVLNAIIPDDTSIAGHLWFIEVRLDTGSDVEQSEIVSPAQIFPSGLSWYFVGLTDVLLGPSDTTLPSTNIDEGLFGINAVFALPTTQGDWATLYSVAADASTLFDYAFNRNPADDDTVGGQFPGSFGVTEVDGDEFLSITFDLLPLSTDLTYIVQADDDPGFPSPDELIEIDPSDPAGPYDDLVGEFSLTGDGGLVDQPNVLSVQNQGYTARVTIGDIETTTTAPTRYIRVVVNGSEGEEVPEPPAP